MRHLIATAFGWGLNPDADALYLNVAPRQDDGTAEFALTVPAAVPVDGFWSISVYDAAGHFVPNARRAYTLNTVTAKRDTDGSVTVRFGGGGGAANCLRFRCRWAGTYTAGPRR